MPSLSVAVAVMTMFAGPTNDDPVLGLVMLTNGAAFGFGKTVVLSLNELLARLVSPSFALMTATLFNTFPSGGKGEPPSIGVDTMLIVAPAPEASESKLHNTAPSTSRQVPALAVTETKLASGARLSFSTTLCAVCGPLFVTLTVYVRLVPAVSV